MGVGACLQERSSGEVPGVAVVLLLDENEDPEKDEDCAHREEDDVFGFESGELVQHDPSAADVVENNRALVDGDGVDGVEVLESLVEHHELHE